MLELMFYPEMCIGHICLFLFLVAQSCLTLCDPMDCSSPGSSVHGILQGWIVECVAISYSRTSSQPMNRTQVFCIQAISFTIWNTREALHYLKHSWYLWVSLLMGTWWNHLMYSLRNQTVNYIFFTAHFVKNYIIPIHVVFHIYWLYNNLLT